MNYRTVEVELEHGRVRARNAEALPSKANALLTILEPGENSMEISRPSGPAGLRRLLAQPDFPLTPQQFKASMESDFWEQ
jgi:hypothetical protein